MEDSEQEIEDYDLLKVDPEALIKLINTFVKLQLIKNTEITGYVHSIDPIKQSIILLLPSENSYTINIIPGHAILNVVKIQPGENHKLLEHKVARELTADEIISKKEKLISWFKKNLLPITESEEKILFGNVSILPPYGVSNICTDNPVVAMQLRKIIGQMPEDYDPDS